MDFQGVDLSLWVLGLVFSAYAGVEGDPLDSSSQADNAERRFAFVLWRHF